MFNLLSRLRAFFFGHRYHSGPSPHQCDYPATPRVVVGSQLLLNGHWKRVCRVARCVCYIEGDNRPIYLDRLDPNSVR